MMRIIAPTAERTVTTPNATMTGLAAPSQGSTALSTWGVRMESGQTGPEHTMDREQVWMVTAGVLTVTAEGRTEKVPAGAAALIPAGVSRRFSSPEGTVEVLVAMANGGVAVLPDGERREVPWAQ
jgi:quercetin dioxygenase-like cupin family protein